MPPTYYRGCWHVVSRGFFCRYRHLAASSLLKAVYNPKAFVPHAASLHQAFAHCARFPTAASRRSLGRVSVPIWPLNPATHNRLGGPLPRQQANRPRAHPSPSGLSRVPHAGVAEYPVLTTVSRGYPGARGRLPTCYSAVRHFIHTRRCFNRSTCMC